MTPQLESITLRGRSCHLWAPEPAPGTLLVLAAGPDFPDQWSEIRQRLTALCGGGLPAGFALAAFVSQDWDLELSPWPAPAVFKGEAPFGGGAAGTFDFLTGALLPLLWERLGGRPAFQALMGYSLGGLFALWALGQGELFQGCTSCSGSLWYPDFLPYLREHPFPRDSRVYLSLGDAEARARNPRIAVVADRTREVQELLQADPRIIECFFEWNPGNHFQEVPGRLARAMAWLLGAAKAPAEKEGAETTEGRP